MRLAQYTSSTSLVQHNLLRPIRRGVSGAGCQSGANFTFCATERPRFPGFFARCHLFECCVTAWGYVESPATLGNSEVTASRRGLGAAQGLAAIGKRLGDMDARDALLAVESASVRATRRSGDSRGRRATARRPPRAAACARLDRARRPPRAGCRAIGIRSRARKTQRRKRSRWMSRAAATRAAPRRFPPRPGQHQVGGGDRRHFDLQVDAVEQRPRDARLVALGATRPGGRPARLAGTAAAARVHRRDQAGCATDRRCGGWRGRSPSRRSRAAGAAHRAPADGTPAARRETARRDGQAPLRPAAAASRHRRAPPCSPNGAARGTAASCRCARRQFAGEATDHAHLEHLGRLERRQDRGQPLRQHRLAGAGRPDHQEVVAAGGGDFERALRRLLALDVLEVGHGLVAGSGVGCGRRRVCSP